MQSHERRQAQNELIESDLPTLAAVSILHHKAWRRVLFKIT